MLKKEYPELAKEWNYRRNDENGVYFGDVACYSHKKVWWKCEHGHEWDALISGRNSGKGCPFCSGRRKN